MGHPTIPRLLSSSIDADDDVDSEADHRDHGQQYTSHWDTLLSALQMQKIRKCRTHLEHSEFLEGIPPQDFKIFR